MAGHWQALVANLAVVALFISAWVNGQFLFAGRPRLWRSVSFGAVMGAGAVASMMLAIRVDGSLFDLRQAVIGLAAFFGGPVSAVVAVAIAIVYRVAAGGPTMLPAVAGILVSALIGWDVARLARDRLPPIASAALLAVTLGIGNLGVLAGLSIWNGIDAAALSLPVTLMGSVAAFISALFVMRERQVEDERDLLRASFVQSRDSRYVKTPRGRYLAVNNALAATLGLPIAGIIGKTDREVLPPDIVERVEADDRQVLADGKGYAEREEIFLAPDGTKFWFASSKEPLYNGDGELIGIGGVTRDVTPRKRLEQELVDSRNQLSSVLAGVTDGIAMFDKDGMLAYCNEQYRSIFTRTSEARRTGAHIRDILRAVAETGEQKGIPEDGQEAWIEQVAATLKVGGEQEIALHDGRWLHVRTRPASDGTALVMVSDVTTIKQAETALLSLNERLRQLAATDGLTGLANRRAFDQALETEVNRSRRTGMPLSLLLADVDRFKAYNDIHGHLAGDDVLRIVGACLREVLRRPGDLGARYGGEEFVAILPGADEGGALSIAENFRSLLRARALPHSGGDVGVVTVSVGVATLTPSDADTPDSRELVRRADLALYEAKRGGRDRVSFYRPAGGPLRLVR